MRSTANVLIMIAISFVLGAQSNRQPLTYASVSNITSTSTVIDNRSTFTRLSDYHGFCATGTGTWSAAIQYSDVSRDGPWTTFAQGSTAVNNASANCYGYGLGYKPYIRFLIVGTVSVSYTGTKNFWFPLGQASGLVCVAMWSQLTTSTWSQLTTQDWNNLTTSVCSGGDYTTTAVLDVAAVNNGSCRLDSTAVTLTGAAFGRRTTIGFSYQPPEGVTIVTKVTGPNAVKVEVCNLTGSTYDPPSATYYLGVSK